MSPKKKSHINEFGEQGQQPEGENSERGIHSQAKGKSKSSIRCWDEAGNPVPDFDQSSYKLSLLKELAMVQLAQLITNKGWNQKTAGEILEVTQPRISDLMQGRYAKFSLDTLITWLYKLEQSVSLQFDSGETAPSSSRVSNENTVEFYSTAISLEPSHPGHYHRRGDAYLGLKQYDLAIGDYTRCIEFEPQRLGPRNNRALAYLRSGQLRACIQDCEKLIELQPLYSGAYAHRGGAYERMEKFDLALDDYSKAIELDFDQPGPYWNRASLYKRLGEHHNARLDLLKLLEIDPKASYAQETLESLPTADA